MSNYPAWEDDPGDVPKSPTGLYRLADDGRVVPCADGTDYMPVVVREDSVYGLNIKTTFIPMRMGGNTFFEVTIYTGAGTTYFNWFKTRDDALARHEQLKDRMQRFRDRRAVAGKLRDIPLKCRE